MKFLWIRKTEPEKRIQGAGVHLFHVCSCWHMKTLSCRCIAFNHLKSSLYCHSLIFNSSKFITKTQHADALGFHHTVNLLCNFSHCSSVSCCLVGLPPKMNSDRSSSLNSLVNKQAKKNCHTNVSLFLHFADDWTLLNHFSKQLFIAQIVFVFVGRRRKVTNLTLINSVYFV